MSRRGMYSAVVGQYMIGPVETETGTKFGVFPRCSPRCGPVATFEGRDSTVSWMNKQLVADTLNLNTGDLP